MCVEVAVAIGVSVFVAVVPVTIAVVGIGICVGVSGDASPWLRLVVLSQSLMLVLESEAQGLVLLPQSAFRRAGGDAQDDANIKRGTQASMPRVMIAPLAWKSVICAAYARSNSGTCGVKATTSPHDTLY